MKDEKILFQEDNEKYLTIHNFMGGILKLPMNTKVEYPEQLLRAFMNELFMIKGVKEVFESYGAELLSKRRK